MIDAALLTQAAAVLDACRARRWRVATAESCTGGLIAATLTAIAGSSDVLECGFVTYSNAAKTTMLGVAAEMLAAFGAVSQPAAAAMAEGALRSGAEVTIAVTGIAGPGGGSADKPVGLVWFGLAVAGSTTATDRQLFTGDRTAIRRATVAHALSMLAARAKESGP